jgi:hypothetical protein
MTCLEKVRLQQLYEAAAHRLGQIHDGPLQIAAEHAWLVQEVLRRTLIERDAAKDRLELHRQRCEMCSRGNARSA